MGLCLLIKGKWRAIMSSERMWHSSLSCHRVSFQGAPMQVDMDMRRCCSSLVRAVFSYRSRICLFSQTASCVTRVLLSSLKWQSFPFLCPTWGTRVGLWGHSAASRGKLFSSFAGLWWQTPLEKYLNRGRQGLRSSCGDRWVVQVKSSGEHSAETIAGQVRVVGFAWRGMIKDNRN